MDAWIFLVLKELQMFNAYEKNGGFNSTCEFRDASKYNVP